MRNIDLVVAGALFGAAIVAGVWLLWPVLRQTFFKKFTRKKKSLIR